jgi:hypothetical protein
MLFIFMFFLYVIFFLSNLYKHAAAESENFSLKYAAVAVIVDAYPSRIIETEAFLNSQFLQTHSTQPYTTGYYAFIDRSVSSETIIPVEPEYDPNDMWMALRSNMAQNINTITKGNFNLIAYTDIRMSAHFMLGDRKITEGRFAETPHEANISRELAELNRFTIGCVIRVYTFPASNNPHPVTLEIVGIYEDLTPAVGSELELILNRWVREDDFLRVDNDSISRNQILTAAPSSRDVAVLTGWITTFDTVVYYVRDITYIPRLIEAMQPTLHRQHAVLDTRLLHDYVQSTYDQTARNALTILVIFGGIGLVSSALLMIYILKSRAYDVGVFRSRGLPRVYTAVIITLESLIVSFFAFILAMVLHTATFEPVAAFMHSYAQETVSDEYTETVGYGWRYVDLPQFETFNVSLGFAEFGLGLAIIIIWVTLIGFLSTVYITRFEPIKVLGR